MSKVITLELSDEESKKYDDFIKNVYHGHENEFLNAVVTGITEFFRQYELAKQTSTESLVKLIELKNINRVLTEKERQAQLSSITLFPLSFIPQSYLDSHQCCCNNTGGSKSTKTVEKG